MHQQAPPSSTDLFDKFFIVLATTYTYVSFGLSGLPGISRLSFVSAATMAILLFVRKGNLYIPPWIILLWILYLYLIVPAFSFDVLPTSELSGALTVVFGTSCVGILLANRLITHRLIAYAMLGAAVTNAVAIMLGIDTTPVEYTFSSESRLSGLLGNANILAISLSLPAMALWLIFKRTPFILLLLSLWTAFYGTYVSGSRKGVLLVCALLLLVTKRLGGRLSRSQIAVLLSTLSVTLVIFYTKIEDILSLLNSNVVAVSRFSKIFYGEDTSFSERKWLIETGYRIWSDSPLVGEGLGQFAVLSGFGAYSHNNYIELLVAGGCISLALYYSLYLLILFYANKYHREQLLVAFIIVGAMVVNDVAAVSFMGRSSMLFLVFAIAYFASPPMDRHSLQAPSVLYH